MTAPDDVKALIVAFLGRALHEQKANGVHDATDLRQDGLIDSLGFLRLLCDLESRLGGPIDLASLAPEQLTKVGALCRHIAAQR